MKRLIIIILCFMAINTYGQNIDQNRQKLYDSITHRAQGLGPVYASNIGNRIDDVWLYLKNDTTSKTGSLGGDDTLHIMGINIFMPYLRAETQYLTSPASGLTPTDTAHLHNALTKNDSTYLIDLISQYAATDSFPGGVINMAPAGTSIPAGTISQVLAACCFISQPPTAAISGGTTYSKHTAGGTFNSTLNWTIGRQASTPNIDSVKINGVTQTYTNPSQPGTFSSSSTGTITYNNTTTFTITVYAGTKSATASTTFTGSNYRFWGYCVGTVPTNSEILAAAGGGSELSESQTKSSFNIVIPSGPNQHFFFAYVSTAADLSGFSINTVPSLSAMTENNPVSVTNVNGFVQNYKIYVSNNTFNGTTVNNITTN